MRAIRLDAEVPGDPLEAFDLFAAAIAERWPGDVVLEAHAGGRVLEEPADVELGRMKVWQPGSRLEADWREPSWPRGSHTHIVVTFEARGRGTTVSVEHSGFDDLGAEADVAAARYERVWRDVLGSIGPAAEG